MSNLMTMPGLLATLAFLVLSAVILAQMVLVRTARTVRALGRGAARGVACALFGLLPAAAVAAEAEPNPFAAGPATPAPAAHSTTPATPATPAAPATPATPPPDTADRSGSLEVVDVSPESKAATAAVNSVSYDAAITSMRATADALKRHDTAAAIENATSAAAEWAKVEAQLETGAGQVQTAILQTEKSESEFETKMQRTATDLKAKSKLYRDEGQEQVDEAKKAVWEARKRNDKDAESAALLILSEAMDLREQINKVLAENGLSLKELEELYALQRRAVAERVALMKQAHLRLEAFAFEAKLEGAKFELVDQYLENKSSADDLREKMAAADRAHRKTRDHMSIKPGSVGGVSAPTRTREELDRELQVPVKSSSQAN